MTLWWVAGQVVDDQQGYVPEGSMRVSMFRNPGQYGDQEFAWDPANRYFSGDIQQNKPGYLTEMLGRLQRSRTGALQPYEADELRQWEATARAMPTRDIASLRAGWQGDLGGSWGGGSTAGNPEWWSLLDPGSPDAGPIMLNLRDKVQHGTATPQERQLYSQVATMAADWDYRATVPQESDANPFGMGDNLFGALMMLGMGASGGAAAGALAAGGLTLGSAGGLAGVAGGMTSMMGEALDEDVLRKMGISLGAIGGAAGLASLASTGISTVGDLLKVVQKAYGVGSKAYGLATGAGSTPDRPGGGGGMADTRTDFIRGGGNTGSTGGGEGSLLDYIGPLLGAAVGAVGTGISLADTQRYMNQLKTRYGQEEGVKNLIDEAYNLAKARYETYYAETREEQAQKQAQYQDALEKYQTRYGQQQQVFAQQQQQFQTIEHQTAMDRDEQYKNHQANRARVDQAYDRQVQEAQQERDFQLQEHGADRSLVLQSYNRRVQEAEQDRQKQYATYDQQFQRHTAREDQRAAQAVEERGLDLNAYQQRQQVGKNLADPATVAAGAKEIYEPLSAAARDRINVQTEEEMARRGVAGGGQYSNLMAAKAFAPLEQQMWQNSLQQYIAAQQGAANAYTQQDLTMAPEYRWAARPEFATSPEYRQMNIPDLAGSPGFTPLGQPQFERSRMDSVPGAPRYDQMPGVPGALKAEGAPAVPGSTNAPYYPRPYSPYGAVDGGGGGAGGGGAGGALANAGPLAAQLGKLLGGNTGLISQVMKLFGGGGYTDADISGSPDPWALYTGGPSGTYDGYYYDADLGGGYGGYSDADLSNFNYNDWAGYEAW